MNTFGTRLREMMKRRGVSRNWLAKSTSRNRCVVSFWINDHSQPKLDSIQEICKVLDLDEEEIVWLVIGPRNAL